MIQRPGSDGRGGPALHAGMQDSLRAELRDRMDAPDLEDDITTRTVANIITEICRDLGLDALPGTHPWTRRTPDDIRQLCARAAAPSVPHPPGAGPQPGPQDPRDGGAQRLPGSQPDKPAAIPRTQPGPIHAGSDPPGDPAADIATILRHPTRAHGQWHPPPEA